MNWTLEQKDIIRYMWAAGAAVWKIAAATGKSRNAVIGKAARMGLGPHRRPPGFLTRKQRRANAPPQPHKPRAALRIVDPNEPIVQGTPAIFDDASLKGLTLEKMKETAARRAQRIRHQSMPVCQWSACRQPPIERGKPYCDAHTRRYKEELRCS